jgi:thioesterase domain-containing protein
MAWDLAREAMGQLRVADGAVLGWDMGAVLAMATAAGLDPRAAVELLPVIEAAMVRAVNAQIRAQRPQ